MYEKQYSQELAKVKNMRDGCPPDDEEMKANIKKQVAAVYNQIQDNSDISDSVISDNRIYRIKFSPPHSAKQ